MSCQLNDNEYTEDEFPPCGAVTLITALIYGRTLLRRRQNKAMVFWWPNWQKVGAGRAATDAGGRESSGICPEGFGTNASPRTLVVPKVKSWAAGAPHLAIVSSATCRFFGHLHRKNLGMRVPAESERRKVGRAGRELGRELPLSLFGQAKWTRRTTGRTALIPFHEASRPATAAHVE